MSNGNVTNICNGGVVGVQTGNLSGVTIHAGGGSTCRHITSRGGQDYRCDRPAGHAGAHTEPDD